MIPCHTISAVYPHWIVCSSLDWTTAMHSCSWITTRCWLDCDWSNARNLNFSNGDMAMVTSAPKLSLFISSACQAVVLLTCMVRLQLNSWPFATQRVPAPVSATRVLQQRDTSDDRTVWWSWPVVVWQHISEQQSCVTVVFTGTITITV